jgi:hypothetical protein
MTSPGILDSIDHFAEHCRKLYYSTEPVDASALYISTAIASASLASRPAYTAIQSRIRAEAHAHHLSERISAFYALLNLAPFESLSRDAKSDASRARRERRDQLAHLLGRWAGHAGCQPFLRSLYAMLAVQAGEGACVAWELNDAVLYESG